MKIKNKQTKVNHRTRNTWKDYWSVFAFIIKCTFIGFGGGNALFPVISKYAVQKYKWIDKAEMEDIIVTTNMLPGAAVVQSLSYIAIKKLGKIGILVTTIAILPNVFLAIGFYYGLTWLPIAYLYVINVAVMGVIIAIIIVFSYNYFKQAKKEMKTAYVFGIMLFSFVFVFFVPSPLNIPAFLMVAALIFLFLHALYKIKKSNKIQAVKKQNIEKN